MKILISPTAFKGSLSAVQAAQAIARGLQNIPLPKGFSLHCLPIADGGDATAEVLLGALQGRLIPAEVQNPLGETITACFGLLPDGSAVIELARASGMQLLQGRSSQVMRAGTYGTGQLIRAALDRGCRRFIIGLGGSATVDAGAGLLQALGVELLDSQGQPIGPGGGELHRLAKICTENADPRLKLCEFLVACDVDNPLLGENGAARVFGPQKGANPQQVEILEKNLAHFAAQLSARLPAGVDATRLRHGGAAGGTALSLALVLGAKLCPGADIVLDALDFDRQLAGCDLLITAEGQLDAQSSRGKAPYAAARRARASGKTVIALCGALAGPAPEVFDAVFSIVPGPMPLAQAMAQAPLLLENAARQLGRLIVKLANNQW